MQLHTLDWIIALLSVAICFVPALFFGKRSGQEHRRVLRLRPLRALVAGRPLHGRHHVLQRHPQPGRQLRPHPGRGRQLAVVGLHPHRRLHGLLLCAALAPLRRPHRPGVLRTALLRQSRRRGARLPRRLPGPVLQLHDHGHGQPGRLQDRRRPVRLRALADAAGRRAAERGLRRPLRTVGRAGHRHDPVLHQDVGGHRRGVLRRHPAAGRRAQRPGGQALATSAARAA